MNLTPKEIVEYLDDYIISQNSAKKTIALALRTRYRRMQLDETLQNEIMPKNILMIGSTGVGKTEISRRLAKMMRVPFIKVEASKYTEVGFVGRDVESMIRDLVINSISIVKAEQEEENEEKIKNYVTNKIVEKLLPPLPAGASESKKDDYQRLLEAMEKRVESGEMDDKIIELEIAKLNVEFDDTGLPPEMAKVQESFSKVFASINKEDNKRSLSVKDAKIALKHEAASKLLDMSTIHAEALRRAEDGGIIFLDEIDKIALSEKSSGRNDPSKEGVQRDLLPIVEGSSVSTKYGTIKTDHILFIAAGAFHVSKPSDLIPELQGRFPLRVELESLTEETLYSILTQTQNSLLKQYQALLGVEGVELIFEDEAIRAIAKLTHRANELTEDIGARRLHTVLEKILQDISFDADLHRGEEFRVTASLVHEKLAPLAPLWRLKRGITPLSILGKNMTKAGFVSLIGRPNAGKSTLMNSLLGEKIAMVSQKANATRRRSNAIVMHNEAQIIFVDTPGLHEREKILNQYMLDEALKAIGDCDLIVYLAPVTDSVEHYEKFLTLNKKNTKHIIVISKIDQVKQEKLFKTIAAYNQFSEHFEALIPVAVPKRVGHLDLLDTIAKNLPDSPYLFDPEDLTSELVRDIYAGFIREAIFENVSDEVPYESDVIIESIESLKKESS